MTYPQYKLDPITNLCSDSSAFQVSFSRKVCQRQLCNTSWTQFQTLAGTTLHSKFGSIVHSGGDSSAVQVCSIASSGGDSLAVQDGFNYKILAATALNSQFGSIANSGSDSSAVQVGFSYKILAARALDSQLGSIANSGADTSPDQVEFNC